VINATNVVFITVSAEIRENLSVAIIIKLLLTHSLNRKLKLKEKMQDRKKFSILANDYAFSIDHQKNMDSLHAAAIENANN